MSRPAPKPTAVDEVVRVLRIYDMLVEELEKRAGAAKHENAMLIAAERIAARTTD